MGQRAPRTRDRHVFMGKEEKGTIQNEGGLQPQSLHSVRVCPAWEAEGHVARRHKSFRSLGLSGQPGAASIPPLALGIWFKLVLLVP